MFVILNAVKGLLRYPVCYSIRSFASLRMTLRGAQTLSAFTVPHVLSPVICHPERSEGTSPSPCLSSDKILLFAQDDIKGAQTSSAFTVPHVLSPVIYHPERSEGSSPSPCLSSDKILLFAQDDITGSGTALHALSS
ncbi:MAG: hypothetical protein ACYCWE_18775 [Eubacteriales bacterium]